MASQSLSFHLSLHVADLDVSKQFYSNALGCNIEHSEATWCNVNFFGHQLTLHQSTKTSPVTGEHAIDHFGVNLTQSDWSEVLDRLRLADVHFQLLPLVTPERGKFIILDPNGSALEFKYSAVS